MTKLLSLFLISMVPIIELRGAIPMGIAWGFDFLTVYVVCVLGNLVPVPILIPFAKKVLDFGATLPKIGVIFRKIINIGEKKIQKVSGAVLMGLFLFVAVPLPGTGAWTGCLIATLLGLPLKKAFLPIAAGVMTAGIIMGVASYGLLGILGL